MYLEKKYNYCESSKDCVAHEAYEMPTIHVNKKHLLEVFESVEKKYFEARDSCTDKMRSSTWNMRSVHTKDLLDVHRYTCEQKICVPHFDGEQVEWHPYLENALKNKK